MDLFDDQDRVIDGYDLVDLDFSEDTEVEQCILSVHGGDDISADREQITDHQDGSPVPIIDDLFSTTAQLAQIAPDAIEQAPPDDESDHAITRISSVLRQLASDLLDATRPLSITLPAPLSRSGVVGGQRYRQLQVSFPGKTSSESWRFTVILRLLELIHEAMSAEVIVTKRDMYYRDPALFGSQAVVDRHIDLISASLRIPRSQLHVTAAAKGLIAGALSICRRDGSIIELATQPDAILISQPDDIRSIDVAHVLWVLVIEKEATFQSIMSSAFWAAHRSQGIIVTGKGYPDIATRALLHLIATPSPKNNYRSPHVLGLVDFDPDGLSILSTYKHGSAAMQPENHQLAVPTIHHLGLCADHLMLSSVHTHQVQGLLPLSTRDRKKAASMLKGNELLADRGLHASWRRDLHIMLMLNYKAELQILDAMPGGLQEALYRGLPVWPV